MLEPRTITFLLITKPSAITMSVNGVAPTGSLLWVDLNSPSILECVITQSDDMIQGLATWSHAETQVSRNSEV